MTSRSSTDPAELLPLKPVDFLVLLTLARGERHGYGIVQDIAEQTDGRIQLVPGNLYAVLNRLRQQDLLGEVEKRTAPDLGDRRRRYYCITPLGRTVLRLEADRLKSLVGVAESLEIL